MSPSRDPTRRNKELTEAETFDRLKAELTGAFATPDGAYRALDPDTVIKRHEPSGRTA